MTWLLTYDSSRDHICNGYKVYTKRNIVELKCQRFDFYKTRLRTLHTSDTLNKIKYVLRDVGCNNQFSVLIEKRYS